MTRTLDTKDLKGRVQQMYHEVAAHPDRKFHFETEAATVLHQGGRLVLADIVTTSQLPEGVTCDTALWVACVGGAAQVEDYQSMITAGRFPDRDHARESSAPLPILQRLRCHYSVGGQQHLDSRPAQRVG